MTSALRKKDAKFVHQDDQRHPISMVVLSERQLCLDLSYAHGESVWVHIIFTVPLYTEPVYPGSLYGNANLNDDFRIFCLLSVGCL